MIFARLTAFGLFLSIGHSNTMERDTNYECNRPYKCRRVEKTVSLHDALHAKDFFTFWIALESGADPNEKNKDGFSILWNMLSSQLDEKDKREWLQLLANKNVDVDALTPTSKSSVLHSAAYWASITTIEKFIELKANVNIQDINLQTPLHALAQASWRACNNQDDSHVVHNNKLLLKTAHLLINAGANLNIQDREGNTPLHLLAHNTTIATLLIISGADYDIRNNNRETIYDYSHNPRLKNRDLIRNEIIMPSLSKRCNISEFIRNRPIKGLILPTKVDLYALEIDSPLHIR